MVDSINAVLVTLINFLFGPIMLCVYFGVGIMMTIRLKGVQFRRFGVAFRECVGNIKGKETQGSTGQIKSFKALATALSSCVGNGNIVGVAAAIAIGGPGAIFWMWIAALFGMATKFSEICLAMHFRVQDEEGNFRGGVMYILSRGMKNKALGKFLGGAFALFTVMVSFISCGALQANTISNALGGENSMLGMPLWLVAAIVLVLDGLVVWGGLKKIANVTTILTPVMALIYLGFGIIIILMNITQVPTALLYIVKSAFTGDAAVGGVAGATMMFAIQKGVSRGVFSNEAGIGSSAIVHATAQTDQPTRQSLYGIVEVFFDTIVICTITALIIMTTGVWNSGVTDGTALASQAFTGSFGTFGNVIMMVSLVLFCFSTMFGWYTYGESAFAFLFGANSTKVFAVLHCLVCALGALVSVSVMWNMADVANGLMALPNLLSLFLFGGLVVKDTKEFFAEYDKTHA